MSDRVGVMSKGKLEQVGAPFDIYHHPNTFFVADFVGAANCLRGVVRQVLAPENYTVDLSPSDLSVTAKGVPGMAAGDRVAALARPEAAKIDDSVGTGLRAHGTIIDVSYAGPQIAYTVAANGFGELAVFTKTDTRSGLLELGREVTLSWDTSDVWIFPVDDELSQGARDPGEVPAIAP